jgi:polyferredoxin
MVHLSSSQKGFVVRMGVLGGMLVAGLILRLIAEGLISGMETTADMGIFSWISMFSGLAFSIATPVMAIATLRYGRRHEAAIREHAGLSRLLTIYRILFWLAVICVLLVAAGLIWLATHIGPVR